MLFRGNFQCHCHSHEEGDEAEDKCVRVFRRGHYRHLRTTANDGSVVQARAIWHQH